MPNSADDVDEIIDDLMAGPKSATVDGRSATAQSVDDALKVRNDRASQGAAAQGHFGLRFTRLVPPGCG